MNFDIHILLCFLLYINSETKKNVVSISMFPLWPNTDDAKSHLDNSRKAVLDFDSRNSSAYPEHEQ